MIVNFKMSLHKEFFEEPPQYFCILCGGKTKYATCFEEFFYNRQGMPVRDVTVRMILP